MPLIQQGRTTTGAVAGVNLDTSTAANVASQTINTTAQMAMPLLQRLSAFSGRAVNQGTQKMVSDAKEQAVVDVANGDFKLEDNPTVYGMAYDGAAKTAYISDTTKNMKATAERLAAQNRYEPNGAESFKKAWEMHQSEYKKTALKIDNDGYIDAVTGDMAKQYGDAAYTKLAALISNDIRNLQIKESEESLSLLEDEYVAAVVSGNENAIGASLSSMRATLSSMQQTGQIGERGIESKWKILSKRVLKSTVKNEFATKMQNGTAAEYISTFRDNVKKSSNFKNATPKEIDEMMDDMYSTLSKKHSFEDSEVRKEKENKERKSTQLKEDLNEAWLVGTLDVNDVDTALKSDLITPAEHKAYSKKVFDTGAKFTDTGVELRLVQNMEASSVDDIMNIPNMTNEDKMKYIKQLRTFQSSNEGKWTSTVQGKASLQLLRNKFNITQAGMLAKLTKQGDIEAYNKAYQSFILEMEDLEPEKRESRSMHYAQAVLDTMDAEDLEKNKSVSKVIQERDVKELQDRVDSYQRQIGERKTEYYQKGLSEFSSRFGETGDIKFNNVKWGN